MSEETIVGLSGGVDSSVAALLLQRAGHALAGLYMQNWEDDGTGPCAADAERRDALAVCARLGIRLHCANFAAEYRERVFAHFLAEYRRGRTPNPDVLCNREIKFGRFLEHARALGATRIATGHYARSRCVDGRWELLRARDAGKDQSYFLHAIDQHALAATLFPLGELHKSEVRRLAREAGLPTHAKKDSTGICFIGERDFREFLGRYLPACPGALVTPAGDIVGEHPGAFFFTLGQRGGLHIGGRRGAAEAPWYVVGKDVPANRLIVSQDRHWLDARRLRASGLHWIAGEPPARSFRCSAKLRYRQPDVDCRVEVDGSNCTVHFDPPQQAAVPGQSVVFYAGEACLGGGVIEASDAAFGGWSPAATQAMEPAHA